MMTKSFSPSHPTLITTPTPTTTTTTAKSLPDNPDPDSDSDDDDDEWLRIPLHPYNIKHNPALVTTTATRVQTPPPKRTKLLASALTVSHHLPRGPSSTDTATATSRSPHRRSVLACTYHTGDDVTIQHRISDTTVTLNCQVVTIKRTHTDTTNYHLLAENARPNDARIILTEQQMRDHQTVQPWSFDERPTVLTTELVECATTCGVAIVPTVNGNGLRAIRDLPAGHLIPYWGKLSAIQRDGGMYNAEIANGVFVVADDPQYRGPAVFCNDNTVVIGNDGTAQRTTRHANAELTWTIPNDTYLDDWKNYKNDGEDFAMYVELVRDVKAGEDISVCYGADEYWNDAELGKRMSNAIVMQ